MAKINLETSNTGQGFFQAVWFTTVYQIKIEFTINLVQSHPKPTPPPCSPPHGVG